MYGSTAPIMLSQQSSKSFAHRPKHKYNNNIKSKQHSCLLHLAVAIAISEYVLRISQISLNLYRLRPSDGQPHGGRSGQPQQEALPGRARAAGLRGWRRSRVGFCPLQT